MADSAVWITALRRSHERFAALVQPLNQQGARQPSYDDEWSIADVTSHLGSQAEIFGLFLEAGLTGGTAPGQHEFGPIWDRWNDLPAERQVDDSVSFNEEFVSRLEGLDESQRNGFTASLFGTEQDLAGLCAMRLGEHAVHTWDIAVALDPQATLAGDAVELLISRIADTASRAGKPQEPGRTIALATSEPARRFQLVTGPEVSLGEADEPEAADIQLPAEALIRLVYGRLDPAHTPAALEQNELLDQLRHTFPGF